MPIEWDSLVPRVAREFGTPCYLCAWQPVSDSLSALAVLQGDVEVRHWLSFKTHPVRPIVRRWKAAGLGVEVVSSFELEAALQEGFTADTILINGVAKHHWLPRYRIPGLRVHFDSQAEIEALLDDCIAWRWRVGVRCHVPDERDPDEPTFGGQFGMIGSEAVTAMRTLVTSGADIESVHFHVGSNISSAAVYQRGLDTVARLCHEAGVSPKYVDCGGGLPAKDVLPVPSNMGIAPIVDLLELRFILSKCRELFPSLQEIWLENGRFVTSRSAILIVKVLDIKQREECRYLICNGGRTNHALVSDWELHEITCVPTRGGPNVLTTVCGPTCMTYDRLGRWELPAEIAVGDLIVWKDAGAYHIPWETRFSHGLARVVWCSENGELSLARDEETPADWWRQWR